MLLLHWQGRQRPPGTRGFPKYPGAHSSHLAPGGRRQETGSEAPRFKVQKGLEVFVCEVKTCGALNGCLHENKSVPGECCEMLPVCVCVCVYTFVARAAHTHQLVTQQVTAVRKLASTARAIGAHAGATVVT